MRHLFVNKANPNQNVYLPSLDKTIRFNNTYYETNDENEMNELLWCMERGYIEATFTSAEERNAELKSIRMRKEATAKVNEKRSAAKKQEETAA